MSTAREILFRTPPDILYHYTTQAGLLGIINNKDIWASHTQYLNDQREFQLALDVIREELAAMKKRRPEHRDLIGKMEAVATERHSAMNAVAEISRMEAISRETKGARVTRESRYRLRYEEHGNRYLIVSETACLTKKSKPAK